MIVLIFYLQILLNRLETYNYLGLNNWIFELTHWFLLGNYKLIVFYNFTTKALYYNTKNNDDFVSLHNNYV